MMRWRGLVSALCVALVVLGSGGSVTAQSPVPTAATNGSTAVADAELFPSPEEVSRILGIDVGSLGVEGGSSQVWEGSDFYSDELPSAQMAMYISDVDTADELLAGVSIDIVRFDSEADALFHTQETLFGDDPFTEAAFETELSGDLSWTMTFPAEEAGAEGLGGSMITLVTGPVAIVVVAFVSDALELEAETEAITALILERLDDGH